MISLAIMIGCSTGNCLIQSFLAADGRMAGCSGPIGGASPVELNFDLSPSPYFGACAFDVLGENPPDQLTSTDVFLFYTPSSVQRGDAIQNCQNLSKTLTDCETYLNVNNIPYAEATYTVRPTLSLIPSSGLPLTQSTDSLKAAYASPIECNPSNCRIQSFLAADGRMASCTGDIGGESPVELNWDLSPSPYYGACAFDVLGENPPDQVPSTQVFLFYTLADPNLYDGASVACSNLSSSKTGCETYLNAHNIPYAEATYTVQTPAQAINALVSVVESMNLAQGIENSLDQKLQNASAALTAANAANRADAVNKLQAFISATQAQSGNKLTVAQANQLIAEADRIIAVLQ